MWVIETVVIAGIVGALAATAMEILIAKRRNR